MMEIVASAQDSHLKEWKVFSFQYIKTASKCH